MIAVLWSIEAEAWTCCEGRKKPTRTSQAGGSYKYVNFSSTKGTSASPKQSGSKQIPDFPTKGLLLDSFTHQLLSE